MNYNEKENIIQKIKIHHTHTKIIVINTRDNNFIRMMRSMKIVVFFFQFFYFFINLWHIVE